MGFENSGLFFGPNFPMMIKLVPAGIVIFCVDKHFFQFLGTNYQQQSGTLMGAAWAPAYACFYLGYGEETIICKISMSEDNVSLWIKHINNILVLCVCVWGGVSETEQMFLHKLESK